MNGIQELIDNLTTTEPPQPNRSERRRAQQALARNQRGARRRTARIEKALTKEFT